ncbi:MAG: hypothetical protein GC179_08385 [Anaerolineaceae bacterium]|nr:hypothetical protein [Anaerolineaceae bacterium]
MPPFVVIPLFFSPLIYLSGRITAARDIALAAVAGLWLYFIFAISTFDGLSRFIIATLLFFATLVTLYSRSDMRGTQGEEKYYAMLILMTGAVIGLVSAHDLFNLWIWFEVTAVSSYLLVAFYHERKNALAACAKYLIQTASGSIIVLFAIALIFAQSGSLEFTSMHLPITPLMIVAGVLFILGFGVKLALVPTHSWLPDAYAQAPTGISAMLSSIITISALVALLRVLSILNGLTIEWGAVLIGFGTVNILVGNLLALRQDEVKRIFAYSSLSHIGFILLAVGIGLYTRQYTGFYSGMLHLFNHAAMKALAFFAVGTVIFNLRKSTLYVNDLKGLAARDPLTAFALVIACLSLAGIPPLAGFMSKLQIFAAGLESRNPTIMLLIIFAALNSVFSLAYFLPIINVLFQPNNVSIGHPPRTMRLPLLILIAEILMLGILPGLLNGLIMPASENLLHLFGG